MPHALYSSLEEEVYQMFGRIRPEKAQTVDVFSTRILRYDNDGMPFAEQYFIDQQTPCSPVAISEGMQIFKIIAVR